MALKSKDLEQVRLDVPTVAAAGELVRVNLNVSKPTRNAWHTAALSLDTNLSTLIHTAMSEYLKTHMKV